MIIRANETQNSSMTPCCDGTGETKFERFLDGDQLPANINLISKVKLEKGNSIGMHQHTGEIELYYILKGEGYVQDDESFHVIKAGDLMFTDNMHRHSIENRSDETLEFLALIVKA